MGDWEFNLVVITRLALVNKNITKVTYKSIIASVAILLMNIPDIGNRRKRGPVGV